MRIVPQETSVVFVWPSNTLLGWSGEPVRLPDTNTTKTAEYVAVATKTLSRLTPVDKLNPKAKITMNAIVIPNRASALVMKFKASMGPMINKAEIIKLMTEMTWTRRFSSK